MNKILVIGGCGFIGKNIIENLKNHGLTVGCYDLIDKDLADYNYIGNITYDEDFESIVSKYDAIVYLITSVSPKRSMDFPTEPYVNDIPMLIKTLDTARQAGIKKIVFASSGGTVYGDNGRNKSSEFDYNEPKNHYAICKLTSEKILEMYNKLYDMKNIALRISNPFGEGQNPNSNVGAITVFANQIKNNHEITLFGDGNIIRDYVYVKEVAEAFYLALNHNFDGEKPIFNIGSGHGLSLNEIIRIVSSELGIEPVINYLPKREFDVEYNVLNIERAKRLLGYCPSENEENNIKKYVRNVFK